MDDEKERECKFEHCENGLVLVKSKDGKTTTFYRCPYCDEGKNHYMSELPLLPTTDLDNGKN